MSRCKRSRHVFCFDLPRDQKVARVIGDVLCAYQNSNGWFEPYCSAMSHVKSAVGCSVNNEHYVGERVVVCNKTIANSN